MGRVEVIADRSLVLEFWRKRKADRKDAQLLLRLMREDTLPKIWVPSPENRDLRQLLWHRHQLVQMRNRIMNQSQAIAMNQGVRKKTRFGDDRRLANHAVW